MHDEIGRYIKQHEETIAPLYKEYGAKFWELSLSGNEEKERALVNAKERYLKVYNNRDEFQQVRQWRRSAEGLDPLQARQLKLIHDNFVPHQIDEKVLREI